MYSSRSYAEPQSVYADAAHAAPEAPLRDAALLASMRESPTGISSAAPVSHPSSSRTSTRPRKTWEFQEPVSRLPPAPSLSTTQSVASQPTATSPTSIPRVQLASGEPRVKAASASASAPAPAPAVPVEQVSTLVAPPAGSTPRPTRSSTMSISSLLSEEIETPTLRRQSSIASGSPDDYDTDVDRSESLDGHENDNDIENDNENETEAPTAEDQERMTEGTQASFMLRHMQQKPIDIEDIVDLLVTQKAILILPTCASSTERPAPTRAVFEDHVIIPESHGGEWLFVTLSGIKLRPSTSSITILGTSASDEDADMVDAEVPKQKAKTSKTKVAAAATIPGTSVIPFIEPKNVVEAKEVASKELKLVNTSRRPMAIELALVGSIHALLVDDIIPSPPALTGAEDKGKERAAAAKKSSGRSTFVIDSNGVLKRRRRRRITTEEAARVIPEESKDDPYARARYKCNICDKTFSRPYNLRSHRATHAGIKPYGCTFTSKNGEACTWRFARRHDLERHMSSRHAFEKPFKCGSCGAECGRNDSLKRHLEKNPDCQQHAAKEATQEAQISPSTSTSTILATPTTSVLTPIAPKTRRREGSPMRESPIRDREAQQILPPILQREEQRHPDHESLPPITELKNGTTIQHKDREGGIKLSIPPQSMDGRDEDMA